MGEKPRTDRKNLFALAGGPRVFFNCVAMITRPTVLVLGAGASEPYGMPTGFALTQSIVSELRDSSSSLRKQLLSVDEIRLGDVNDFTAQLAASDVASVDTFLSHQEYFMRVGKAAIAAVLMHCEDHRRVAYFPEEDIPACEDHWLGFLWQKLLASRQTFGENQLTIVTFNYDRLVEYRLERSIQHTFGIDPDAATELRQDAVEIIHVHGVLSGRSVLDRGEASADELDASIETIKVLPESNKGVRRRLLWGSSGSATTLKISNASTSRIQLRTEMFMGPLKDYWREK